MFLHTTPTPTHTSIFNVSLSSFLSLLVMKRP
jgi:hypothetical protein